VRAHLVSKRFGGQVRLPVTALALVAFLTAACGSGSASGVGASDGTDVGPVPTPRIPTLASCPTAGSPSSLPSITLNCLRDGPAVDTAALGGRPVLVNLWASWCGPCKQEMPSLQRAYGTFGGQIAFLGVDTKDEKNSANDFLAATSVHYPQVVDTDGDLLHKIGGSGLPVTVVLDATGRSVYSHRGQLRSDDLRTALLAAGVRLPSKFRF
jgi:cytochrome c biogenesis protein CcmG/thiol:disulfide interchange protein DsbE